MSTTEPKKEYSLSAEDRGQYFYVKVTGQRGTLEIAHAYWSEIAGLLLATEHTKILVVEDIPEVISIAEVHQLVTDLSDLPVKGIRVAFVDTYPEHSSLNDFGILVGENRGLTIKAFETEEAAEEWLVTDRSD